MPDWRQTEVLVGVRFRLRSGRKVSVNLYGDNKILMMTPLCLWNCMNISEKCWSVIFGLCATGYTSGANIEIQIKQQNSPNLIRNAPYSLTIPSDSGDETNIWLSLPYRPL